MLFSHATRTRLAERLRRLLGGSPPRVQAAALPWRQTGDGIEIMLVTSRGTGRWVLPKGWPEQHEPLFEAAAREAKEEAGISGTIARREVGCFYYSKRMRSGVEPRCKVVVFPLKVEHVADKWRERKKRSRQWFSPQEAARRVDERDLGELIAGFGVNPRKFAA